MNEVQTTASGGMSLGGVVFVVLLILKLTENLTMSWFWVITSFIWAPVGIILAIIFFVVVVALFMFVVTWIWTKIRDF